MSGAGAGMGMGMGIEDLNVFCGVARIPVRALIEGRGLDPARIGNLMMDERSVQMPWDDPVTNAVNAARPVLDALGPDDRDRIELLVTSTESGLDYSKSVASYVHHHLRLPRRCRMMEVKQACYGATGMVQLAAGYLAGAAAPGAKALIIATDVNPMDEHARYAEPTTGHGAVALLIGDRPRLLELDRGAHGLHSFETMDTSRPAPDLDLYDPDLSLLTYLDCLSASYRDYTRRVPGTRFADSFDHLVMHTPFAGMVRAAHRRMAREFAPGPPAAIEADFTRRVLPSLAYPRRVGNLCSGSLYLALAGLLDTAPASATDGSRVGLYSYGSGCASEFFSGVIPPGAAEALSARRIGASLASRRTLTFDAYRRLLAATRTCLVPAADREVDLTGSEEALAPFRDRGPLLLLTSVKAYRRQYEWR